MKHAFRIALTALTLSAAITATASSSTASTTGEFFYRYTFYADEAHTQWVGEYDQYCYDNWVMTPQVTGETSPHYTTVILGTCPGEVW